MSGWEEPKYVRADTLFPDGPGRCGSCERTQERARKTRGARRKGNVECAALKTMLGTVGQCWAFTSNPHWERDVNVALWAYERRK